MSPGVQVVSTLVELVDEQPEAEKSPTIENQTTATSSQRRRIVSAR